MLVSYVLDIQTFFYLLLKDSVHHNLLWTRSSEGDCSSENHSINTKWRENGKKTEKAAYYASDQSLKQRNERWKKV